VSVPESSVGNALKKQRKVVFSPSRFVGNKHPFSRELDIVAKQVMAAFDWQVEILDPFV
jgi:hypothetical protein